MAIVFSSSSHSQLLYNKGSVYRNRAELYKARFKVHGARATLTQHDIGHIIFGGTVEIMDEVGDGATHVVATVELEKAFELYMSPEHIQAAREKCGYCPATRRSLESDRVRHEVIENYDGEVDPEADTYGLLLDTLESQNHACVARLVEKGYFLASEGKRYVKRITASQIEGRDAHKTLPNTRERQDALMACSTAGQFFWFTDGGYVMNCTDMLLARERREMKVRAKPMETQKKLLAKYASIVADAKNVFAKPYGKWTGSDFKTAIKYKQGHNPQQVVKGMHSWGVSKLKEFYESTYKGKGRSDPTEEWTPAMETELSRLLNGEINDVQESVIYSRALKTQNAFLATKLKTMTSSRRKQILGEVFAGLPSGEKEGLIQFLLNLNSGADADEPIESTETTYPSSDESDTETLFEIEEEASVDEEESEEEDEALIGSMSSSSSSRSSSARSRLSPALSRSSSSSLLTPFKAPSNKSDSSSSLEEMESHSAHNLELSSRSVADKFETRDALLKQVNDLEPKLEISAALVEKLENAEKAVKSGSMDVEHFKVLIQSRGKEPLGSRSRQLEKQWHAVEQNAVIWRQDLASIKKEISELRSRLETIDDEL